MSKRMRMLYLKGDSNSKHFSFFVFYFNISNKISSTPPRLLNFQEFSSLEECLVHLTCTSRFYSVLTREFKLIHRRFELVTCMSELITPNSCFTFPPLIL